MAYTSIDIIYNPKSTGPSLDAAKSLKRDLDKLFPGTINLKATKYPGHAEEIANKCSFSTEMPLIISSSGDGGYNEVINGAIRAQLQGAKPVCAVLPAGNANDHSRTLQEEPLINAIKAGKEQSLDLLKASFTKDNREHVRYAHSYVGLGLTPIIAVELNKKTLNALNELWIVLKNFYKYRPFKVEKDGKVIKLDSIIFANISQMAKILTVAKNAKPNDGLFEAVIFPHSHKIKLIHRLAKATTTGLQPKHFKEYEFKVLKKMPIQFDGEVQFIDKNSRVHITIEDKILKTVI